jgi:hypothetical protein
MEQLDRFISVFEAARAFGVHRSTLYRRAGQDLPAIRCIGGKRGMLLSEVRATLGALPTRATSESDAERAAHARTGRQDGRARR